MRRHAWLGLLGSLSLLAAACVPGSWSSWTLVLPLEAGSVRFAVIGDSGTGGRQQYDVARRMLESRRLFPFTFVLMLGDNIYGREEPADFERKFARPYKALLDAGITFHAALGNHDDPNQRFYAPFNMGGERYYTFTEGDVSFFALDSNYMDPAQLAWLESALSKSGSAWKICFFHHPLYTSGRRHGSEQDLRILLEPLLVKHQVDVVFAGHEHFYERLKPQQGIQYFTSGGAAKVSRDNLSRTREGRNLVQVGYDRDRHFMLVEIVGDTLSYQAISRLGRTIDSGTTRRARSASITDALSSLRVSRLRLHLGGRGPSRRRRWRRSGSRSCGRGR